MAYLPVHKGRMLKEENMVMRLAFARKHKADEWVHTVFVDMTTMHMRWEEAGGHAKRWQVGGSKMVEVQDSKSVAFNFYAAVARIKMSNLHMVAMNTRGKSS